MERDGRTVRWRGRDGLKQSENETEASERELTGEILSRWRKSEVPAANGEREIYRDERKNQLGLAG